MLKWQKLASKEWKKESWLRWARGGALLWPLMAELHHADRGSPQLPSWRLRTASIWQTTSSKLMQSFFLRIIESFYCLLFFQFWKICMYIQMYKLHLWKLIKSRQKSKRSVTVKLEQSNKVGRWCQAVVCCELEWMKSGAQFCLLCRELSQRCIKNRQRSQTPSAQMTMKLLRLNSQWLEIRQTFGRQIKEKASQSK